MAFEEANSAALKAAAVNVYATYCALFPDQNKSPWDELSEVNKLAWLVIATTAVTTWRDMASL